ncbi:TPA: hypothetical protein HA244_01900 [Candidatus Micrarchaeota archaeon]|nr:hypothetical protein [Candidatus Micrarchaeota archaeon]
MPPERPVKAKDSMEVFRAELQTLDSKINLLGQQIKTVEKNQEIIGRTMITLNEKIEKVSRGSVQGSGGKTEIDESKFVTKQEFKELKAILESINPLEYATIDQVKELLDEIVKKTDSKRMR